MSAETVSSVVFARFTTSEALPVAKIGNVVNHVHNLGFAQQVMSRVHAKGDIINPYVTNCGYKDICGNTLGPSATDINSGSAGQLRLRSYHKAGHVTHAKVGGTDVSAVGIFETETNGAQQITWARASADLSGVFQGRHCLNMESFLNTWYEQSNTVSVNLNNLVKAQLLDQNNQAGFGPVGWFGVDDGTEYSKQKKWTTATASSDWVEGNAGDVCKEAMGVCLTPLTSTMRNNTGFNVQTQVMTNILSDLGIDVAAENEGPRNAADKLDSVSYLRLSNYLGKHTNLKAIVEDSNVNSGDSMSKRQLFYELSKQFDVNNKVGRAFESDREKDIAKEIGEGKALTKLVKEEIDRGTDAGLSKAQEYLEKFFCDITQFESGRVAIAFLYKSQTQGVRDTEIRVHMKLCGGIVGNTKYPFVDQGPGSYDTETKKYVLENATLFDAAVGTAAVRGRAVAGKNILTDGDKVGRTFEQMCAIHPLMSEGRPLGVLYA